MKFKENTKYLGVRYSGNLDIKRALKDLEPKTNFIFLRLLAVEKVGVWVDITYGKLIKKLRLWIFYHNKLFTF